MKVYKCKTKCFYRGRLWTPDERLDAQDGEQVPRHFELVEDRSKPKATAKPRRAKTVKTVKPKQDEDEFAIPANQAE